MDSVKKISAVATYPLRHEVLWPHIEKEADCGIEVDKQEGTFHVGALKDETVVSIATFLIEKHEDIPYKNQYRLRAMATSPEHRGANFGKKVIEFAIQELRNRNVEVVWCDAREVALGFYEKLGFKVTGDFYNVPDIGPHKLMYYEIN